MDMKGWQKPEGQLIEIVPISFHTRNGSKWGWSQGRYAMARRITA